MSPTVVLTEVAWDGVRVRRVHRPAAAVTLAPIAEHYLCINLGQPHRLTYECDGHTHSALRHTSDLVLTPANRSSRWQRESEGEGLHLFVPPAFLARIAADRGGTVQELVGVFCVRDPQVEHIGFALLAEAEQGCPGGKLYGDAMALALAAHLLQRYGTGVPRLSEPSAGLSPSRLRRVLAYLEEHLEQDRSLAEIAAVAGISPYHFARLFRQSTGRSPHQYRIERRVERARQLLRAGRASVSEVAVQVGFADQSHLARHFKRLLGTTPGQFARHYGGS